jgi:hypothetical protein
MRSAFRGATPESKILRASIRPEGGESLRTGVSAAAMAPQGPNTTKTGTYGQGTMTRSPGSAVFEFQNRFYRISSAVLGFRLSLFLLIVSLPYPSASRSNLNRVDPLLLDVLPDVTELRFNKIARREAISASKSTISWLFSVTN